MTPAESELFETDKLTTGVPVDDESAVPEAAVDGSAARAAGLVPRDAEGLGAEVDSPRIVKASLLGESVLVTVAVVLTTSVTVSVDTSVGAAKMVLRVSIEMLSISIVTTGEAESRVD